MAFTIRHTVLFHKFHCFIAYSMQLQPALIRSGDMMPGCNSAPVLLSCRPTCGVRCVYKYTQRRSVNQRWAHSFDWSIHTHCGGHTARHDCRDTHSLPPPIEVVQICSTRLPPQMEKTLSVLQINATDRCLCEPRVVVRAVPRGVARAVPGCRGVGAHGVL